MKSVSYRNVAQVQKARAAARKSRLRLPPEHEQGERRQQETVQARSRSQTAEEIR